MEALIFAIGLNLVLLFLSYWAGSRAGAIVSSIIWIGIGFGLYQEYHNVLLLAVVYMIAFLQVFIPLKYTRSR